MRKMCHGTKYTVEQGKTVDRKWSKKMAAQNKRKWPFFSPFRLEFWLNNFSGSHLPQVFLILTHDKDMYLLRSELLTLVFALPLIFHPPKMPTKDVLTNWTLKQLDMVHVISLEMYHVLRGTRPRYHEKRSNQHAFFSIPFSIRFQRGWHHKGAQ